MTARLLDGRGIVIPAFILSAGLALAASRAPLLALAGVGVVVVLLLVLLWAEAVLLLLVAALPWEDLLQYPSETLSGVKVLGFLLVAAWLLRAFARGEPLRLPATLAPVLLFGLLVGASFVLSPDPAAGSGKLLRYVLFIAFFFLITQLAHARPAVLHVLRVLVLSAAAAGLWALVFFLQGKLERAGGPIQDPNDFAYLMAAVLPITGYLFIEERRRRVLWGACFAVLVGSTLATLSRGALIGLLALGVWALASRKVSVSGVLAAGGALAVVVLLAVTFWSPLVNERVESKEKIADVNAASRLGFWDAALRMSYDRPLTGVGPGRFGEEAETYVRNRPLELEDPVVHNTYLEIAAENGVPALLAFLAFLAGSWALLTRARREAVSVDDQQGVRLATAMQATLVAAAVSAIFLSQQLALPLWLVGALATALASSRAGAARPGAARPVLASHPA
jgi:O-antigen ligase